MGAAEGGGGARRAAWAVRRTWQSTGWKSAEVMTSESASMFAGLTSTMLKQLCAVCRFHRLRRRSSQLMNDSPSELSEILLMWYACAFEYVRFGVAVTTRSHVLISGRRSASIRGS